MAKRDPNDFTKATKDLTLERAGYVCSYPGCNTPLVAAHSDEEKSISISEVSHIYGARKASNNRFDPNMSPQERSHSSNAIALCRNHGKMIDSDEIRYTAIKLLRWKALHEKEIFDRQELGNIPTPPSHDVKPNNQGYKLLQECSLEELKAEKEYRQTIYDTENSKRLKRIGKFSVIPLIALVSSSLLIFKFDMFNTYSAVTFAISGLIMYLTLDELDRKTPLEQRQALALREINLLIREREMF